ncbi:MAG: gamma-glutamyltransferase [Bryobacteraceae bacterium]|nr:gamma-glutamyltransferase [Bryobacteraceae bacterium]
MIDFGTDIQAAFAAPRIAFVSLDNVLQVEDSVPAAVRDELATRGHKLSVVPSIGRLHGLAITYDDQGRPAGFEGGADPRGASLAKGSDYPVEASPSPGLASPIRWRPRHRPERWCRRRPSFGVRLRPFFTVRSSSENRRLASAAEIALLTRRSLW